MDPDTVAAEVDGLYIEGPREARSHLRALQDGTSDPFMTQLFLQAVRPGMTVVDIGAFLGQYTLLAARQIGPAGQVYAFEPDPRNLPFLLRNIERNGLRDRVVPVPYAAADRSGERTLFRRLESLSFMVRAIDERREQLFPVGSGFRSYANFLLFLNRNFLVLANLVCVHRTNHRHP